MHESRPGSGAQSASLPLVERGDALDALRMRVSSSLRGVAHADIRFGRHDRMLYATDASIYQVEPIGVVVPHSVDDGAKVVAHLAQEGVSILPRGSGTALAGQTVNEAVVVDFSQYCRAILSVDAERRRAVVEPGVTLDQLNEHLAPLGLMFGPDVATSSHATLGGMIGNNSSGAHSILYGRTVENLLALEVVFADGSVHRLEEGSCDRDPAQRNLADRLAAIVRPIAGEIRTRFPKILRHVDGYALDIFLEQIERSTPGTYDRVNLAHLVCGGEGTLAVTLRAELALVARPKERGLAILGFASVRESLANLSAILATKPAAVELVDDVVIDVALRNTEYRQYVELMPQPKQGSLGAVLYVEYFADRVDDLPARFDALRAAVPGGSMSTYTGAAERLKAWKLRKAGEPLLHGVPGVRKPFTFVEDTAVCPSKLPDFVEEFRAIVSRHGTTAAYYAHASVGCLHIRPLVAIHDPKDRAIMVSIAKEIALLVARYGGALSGEHGDGRVRSPLLGEYFGETICAALREVKRAFDPANLLNPGNIVDSGPAERLVDNLRIAPGGHDAHAPEIATYFDYTREEGFGHAIESCNGAGLCRRMSGGTSMCPSYRALRDERHATRGRGNALRLAVTGQLGQPGQGVDPRWSDAETMATLDLCLSCKACKTECPSNVDISKLKAEYTAQRHAREGVPFATRVFGQVRRLNALGSRFHWIANIVNRTPVAKSLAHTFLGIDPRRSIPAFGPSLFRWFAGRSPAPATRSVILFGDCFSAYNEPGIGQSAVRLLEAFGYRVVLADVGCCGRSLISTGMLAEAREEIARAADALEALVESTGADAVLVLEPSCASALRDDWLELLPKGADGAGGDAIRARRAALAKRTALVEEFLDRAWDTHPRLPELPAADAVVDRVVLHGHCHQKALWGAESSARFLRRIFGARMSVLDTGCCGMAGSFGYAEKRYELSMKIGEDRLFPAVRAATDAVVCAPGTSCRHQIHDGTEREALHPVDLAARALGL
ncbi:MAG: FAD-binding protein [Planctomycetaceae bacterium]|nr:FAD-binding protein [Planctomycetaceae bacterium]